MGMIFESKAQDEAEWVDDMSGLLKAMLTKGDPQYKNWEGFHGPVQKMLKRALSEWLPLLPPMKIDEDKGLAHFEPMIEWMAKNATAEEMEEFHKKFPHLPMPAFDMMDSMSAAMGSLDLVIARNSH